MEAVTYRNILSQLVEAVPEFQPDSDDLNDNLAYLVFADLIRFVTLEIRGGQNPQLLQKVFGFLEEAAKSKDKQVIDLLSDALYELAIRDAEKSKSLMGRATRKLVRKVEKEVYK
jgi:hypothetical protein